MARRRYWYRESFPPSRPRDVEGGIKVQSKRGAIGETWWAKRWIEVLESFDVGARLGRGRSYARRGQVMSLEVTKGKVTAEVQGSRRTPYRVSIAVRTLTSTQWKGVTAKLSKQAVFAARLVAGEMPQDIERVFEAAGLSLFPLKHGDLRTDCSCPDWSNPCKHIAAVHYVLGETFDSDPFLIFRLRGIQRSELIKGLENVARSPAKRRTKAGRMTRTQEAPAPPPERVPLPADPQSFWTGLELSDDLFGPVEPAAIPAVLVRRLGSFPMWRGRERFLDAIEPIYNGAVEVGMDVFLGELSD